MLGCFMLGLHAAGIIACRAHPKEETAMAMHPAYVAAQSPWTTPPQGWRSWNAFYLDINEQRIYAQAEAMVRPMEGQNTSLSRAGFRSIGIDDGWQACGSGVNGSFHDAAGNPLVNLTLFPDLAAMAHKAHTLGLTAGFYMNNCACAENQFADPAMIDRIYARSVAAFVRWGFDSLKVGH